VRAGNAKGSSKSARLGGRALFALLEALRAAGEEPSVLGEVAGAACGAVLHSISYSVVSGRV